jgi:hypothetical protein
MDGSRQPPSLLVGVVHESVGQAGGRGSGALVQEFLSTDKRRTVTLNSAPGDSQFKNTSGTADPVIKLKES